MVAPKKGKHAFDRVHLNYQLIRNTTSPDEKETGVQSFVANLPAFEILKLGTRGNLRACLAEHDPRKRNRVHDAIRETIDTDPQRFITRNSGFVITASSVAVDDNARKVSLVDANVINGAQSQGEIRALYDELVEAGRWSEKEEPPFYVRATIIVDEDDDEIIETAIARNIATPVKSITEAGARGQLDELEKSIRQAIPGAQIRKKESDVDVLDTRRILQLCRLLMPTSVSGNASAAEKLRAYKNPEQCLTDFCEWFDAKKSNGEYRSKYDFTVQMAPHAIQEYEKWENHPAWNGHKFGRKQKKADEPLSVPVTQSPGFRQEFCSR
jgi:AIPR protein